MPSHEVSIERCTADGDAEPQWAEQTGSEIWESQAKTAGESLVLRFALFRTLLSEEGGSNCQLYASATGG